MKRKTGIIAGVIVIVIVVIVGINFNKTKDIKPDEVSGSLPVLQVEPTEGVLTTVFRKEYDLETLDGIENVQVVTDAKSCSGTHSCELNSKIEYGINLIYPIASIPGSSGLNELKISAAIWSNDAGDAQWVLEILDSTNNSIYWNSIEIGKGPYRWDSVSFNFKLPVEFISEKNSLKIYPWNKNQKSFWVDNINVAITSLANVRGSHNGSFIQTNYYYSFENDEGFENTYDLTEEIARTGTWSALMKGKDTYSKPIFKKVKEVTSDTLRKIAGTTWLYPESDFPDIVFIASIKNSKGDVVFWDGKPTLNLKFKAKTWSKFNMEINIPYEKRGDIGLEDEISIHFWNRSDMKVYVDDVELVFGEEGIRQGSLPFVDMNLASRETYNFSRYHPPYRVSYIQSVNLNNSNTAYLIKDSNKNFVELFPTQEILALNNNSGSVDDLINFSEKGLELSRWCADAESFYLLGRYTMLPFSYKNTKLYSVNTDGSQGSELLAISNSKSYLIRLNSESSASCSNSETPLSWTLLKEDGIGRSSLFQIADFNMDGREDLMSVDTSTGVWNIRTFQNSNWTELSNGIFPKTWFVPPFSFLSGSFVPNNKNIQIIIAHKNNLNNYSFMFEYNSSTGKFASLNMKNNPYMSDIFIAGQELIRVNIDADVNDEILLVDHSNRFDVKRADFDESGFHIVSRIEFKAEPPNSNPKFYEMSRIVYGKFGSAGTRNLICVLRNCLDDNFDGVNCEVFGGPDNLPDQVQMYNLKLY